MSRLRTALVLPVLGVALLAAGCGGDAAAVDEVPGAPPALDVPHQRGADDLSGGGEDATPTPTPGAADAAETPAGTGATGTTGETGTTSEPTGAAATPAPATEDSPTSDQAPAAGSPPEQFEQFCEENAGAC